MLKNNKILILCHPRSRSSYACNIISSYQKNKHGYLRELPWELLNGKQIEIEKYLTKLQKLKLKEEDQKRVNEDIEFFSKRWQYASMFRELANDDKPFVLKYFPGAYNILNVDVMKELPMTLLLRPFNFETLATHVYQFAKDELLEEAALPALLIILAGVLPVILMNRVLNRFLSR